MGSFVGGGSFGTCPFFIFGGCNHAEPLAGLRPAAGQQIQAHIATSRYASPSSVVPMFGNTCFPGSIAELYPYRRYYKAGSGTGLATVFYFSGIGGTGK